MKWVLVFLMYLSIVTSGMAQWKPVGDKIKTFWADKIDPNCILPEYPRPIMERQEWSNLNGLWDYAIQPTGKSERKNCVKLTRKL